MLVIWSSSTILLNPKSCIVTIPSADDPIGQYQTIVLGVPASSALPDQVHAGGLISLNKLAPARDMLASTPCMFGKTATVLLGHITVLLCQVPAIALTLDCLAACGANLASSAILLKP